MSGNQFAAKSTVSNLIKIGAVMHLGGVPAAAVAAAAYSMEGGWLVKLLGMAIGHSPLSCSAATLYLRIVNAIRLMSGPVMLPFTVMSNDKV